MKILLFGGTREGRELSLALAGHDLTVCVVSRVGEEALSRIPGICVRVGRQSPESIRALLSGMELCIDATHPYAQQISSTLRDCCRETGVPLRRVLRSSCAFTGGPYTEVATARDAAAVLSGTEGNILLTTGTRELAAYAALPRERLYVRVLPCHESFSACEAAGILHSHIVAMQGPFSRELNVALLRQLEIRHMVTKESGNAGGFPEKMEAAEETGTAVIVLTRPQETGITPEELLREIREAEI